MTASATIASQRAEETEAAGERLGRTLGPSDVVGLIGELGAGKTCFVQGLTRGLGVTVHATSPTFVLAPAERGALRARDARAVRPRPAHRAYPPSATRRGRGEHAVAAGADHLRTHRRRV